MTLSAEDIDPDDVELSPSLTREVHDFDVEAMFAEGGPLAAEVSGYRKREGQVLLSSAVDRIFSGELDGQRTLLAEGPTGVGKSVAYLVPAVRAALARHERTIVATANIALQEQLVGKDLPMLQRAFGVEGVGFTFAIAKGFQNYACREALDVAQNERLIGKRLPVLREQQQLERVIEWAEGSELGDISELPFELMPSVRRAVTVSSEDCLGKKCMHYNDGSCFPRVARKQLEQVDIVVTNYHLYFIDLELRMGGARGVLPLHSNLVFDEAHRAGDIARQYFARRLSPGGARTAVDLLVGGTKRAERLGVPRNIDPDLRNEVLGAADAFFYELAQLEMSKRYEARLDCERMFDGSELERLMRLAATRLGDASENGGTPAAGREFLRQRRDLCLRHAGLIAAARELLDGEEWVYFVENETRPGGTMVSLVAEPMTAAGFLRRGLWESKESPKRAALVSATLADGPGEDGFEFVAAELGVDDFAWLAVESPFDYSRCLLVTPPLCDPNNQAFAAEVSGALVELVEVARGRTLGLFTSYRVLNAVRDRLMRAGLPYPVLCQGDAPRTQLVDQFRRERDSVLLGTESLWEGVDVPGESLTALLIDRLPFDPVSDPVLDARKAVDSRWFRNYYLPRAVLRMRQGVGRLIRSVSDYGVVVVCDRRMVTKPYGAKFIEALPHMPRARSIAAVEPFLDRFR